MIKVRHRVYGHVRDCPSQVCADKMLSNKKKGEAVWELANKPTKGTETVQKRVFGEPVKKETLKESGIEINIPAEPPLEKTEQVDIEESIEVDELVELRERYEAQKGKKPHWKMGIKRLREELGDNA